MKRPLCIPAIPAGLVRWLLAAWLAAGLLLAHGCHGGDVDHELFTSLFAGLP